MPYASNADLPEAARKKLSAHQQDIFRSAFNNALAEYDGDESKAFATAWAAAQGKTRHVRKSQEEGDLMKTSTVEEKKNPLQRLLSAIGPRDDEVLAKAMPPKRGNDDDDDEDDDGAPSTEDREKAAAPKAPVNRNDGSPDGDDDADDSDAQPDDDPNDGGDADPNDDDANKGDDDSGEDDRQAPPPMPMKKKPPVMRKSLAEADDDDVMAEIRRRAQDSPDFLKSLLEGDDAADILEAIDMSKVVAQIVQQASETIAAKDIQIATLTKSLGTMAGRLDQMVEMNDAIAEGLAKSLELQGDLLKGFGEVRDDVVLLKGQDSGAVSHGQGTLIPPKREDPPKRAAAADEEDTTDPIPDSVGTGRLQRALMKSIEVKLLDHDTANRLMGRVGSKVQNQRVWKGLSPEVREIALTIK